MFIERVAPRAGRPGEARRHDARHEARSAVISGSGRYVPQMRLPIALDIGGVGWSQRRMSE
jgi:hypothetical protein